MFIFQFVRLFIIFTLPSLCLGQKKKSAGDIDIEVRKYKNFNGQSAEYEVGTFKKAINPKVNNFREFPKYLNKLKKKKTDCNVLHWRNSL